MCAEYVESVRAWPVNCGGLGGITGFTISPSISPWPLLVLVLLRLPDEVCEACVIRVVVLPGVGGGGGDWLQACGSDPMTMPRTPWSEYPSRGGEGSSFMVMRGWGGVRFPLALLLKPLLRVEDVFARLLVDGSGVVASCRSKV